MSHAIDMNQRIPKSVEHKLRQIRWQQALVTIARAVAIAVAGLLGTMLLAMLVDWLVTLFDPWVRTALTVCSLGVAAALLLVFLKPLKRAFGWSSAARMADDAVPQLQQRWLAVTESSSNPPDHGPTYDAMLEQVASEAIALGPLVEPRKVVDADPLKKSTLILIGWIALAALIVGAWPRGSILAQRFWSFGGDVSATKLASLSGSFAVPRGESARIHVQPSGMKPQRALMFLELGVDDVEEIEILPDDTGDFVYSVASVEQSFRYRLRGGDAQTQWHAVDALERPQFESIRVMVDSPDYVDRPRYERDHLPSRIKAIDGSELTLEFAPRKPIARMEIAVSQLDENGKESTAKAITIPKADDGVYRLKMSLRENLILKPSMISHDGLTQRDQSVCRVQVIADKAPVARILSPKEEMEVAADETIKVEFEAHDDHGIAKAELVVYEEPSEEGAAPKVLHVQEIPLDEGNMPKHMMSSVDLDLSKFDLNKDSSLSFAIRVTDNRNMDAMEASKIATRDSKSERDSKQGDAMADSTGKDGDRPLDATEPSKTAEGDANADSAEQKVASEERSDEHKEVASDSPKGPSKQTDELERMAVDGATSSELADEDSASKSEAQGENVDNGERNESDRIAADDASESSEERQMSDGVKNDSATDSDDAENLAASDTLIPKDGGPPSDGNQGEQSDAQASAEQNSRDQTDPSDRPEQSDQMASKQSQPNNNANPNGTQQDSQANSPLASVDLPQGPMREMSERDNRMIRRALDTDEGQGSMSIRMRLKIVERMSMDGQEFEASKSSTAIRKQLESIDLELESAQKLLTTISENMEKEDASPTDRAKRLDDTDKNLEEAKSLIAKLKKKTSETPLAFIGLQMVNMGQVHVVPARDRVIRIRRSTVDAQSSGRLRIQSLDALGHITQAREFLAGLVRKVEDIGRDKKMADKLQDIAKMFEIYVENRHRILRESQQNRNPLKRKMAIIDVDEEYLKRRTEIEEMRREMMAEFARMLADDPRLLRRYLDSVRRRQTSLRDRLMDATERQEEISEEVNAWMNVADNQKADLWKILVDKRLQQVLPMSSKASEITDRVESTLPLSLNAEEGSAAGIIAQSRQIAIAAQDVALAARRQLEGKAEESKFGPLARTLVDSTNELISSLERLEFETPETSDDIRGYLAERLVDARTLLEDATAWQQTAAGLSNKDYPMVAASDQQQLQKMTEALHVDFGGLEESVENLFQRDQIELPEEIRTMIKELHALMESITMNQFAGVYCLSHDTIDGASEQVQIAVDRFYEAEDLFDQIRVKTAAILDEQEVRNPTVANLREPTLDEFLQRLEREPQLFQQLELGNRRTNLRVIQDWMMWQTQNGGGGMQLNQAAANARKRMKQNKEQKGVNGKPENREEETEHLKEMLANSIDQLQKRIDDPGTSEEAANQLRKQLAQMKKMMSETSDDSDAAAQWKALVKSDRAQAVLRALASGESLPDQQWNKLMSQLEEGLWQVRGRTPPPQYRQAIQQYQEIIRQVESL